METAFENEQEAARAVLRDVCRKLLDAEVKYAVVGGWVPFLLSSTEELAHPGTYDADILLEEESLSDGSFRRAVDALLKDGYLRPAKNEFQAFHVMTVAGEQRVFHADFLNPGSPKPEDLTFVRVQEGERLGSAYTPAMKAVFDYADWRACADDPALAGVRFASELSFIVTKAHATTSKKRLRDVFDIFLTLRASKDAGAVAKRWQVEADRGVESVKSGREFLRLAVKSEASLRYAEKLLQGSKASALRAHDVVQVLKPLL